MIYDKAKTAKLRFCNGSAVTMLVVFSLIAQPVWSTQVKLTTPSGGSGTTSSGQVQVWLTVGQGIIGKTEASSGINGAEFGLWYLLRDTQFVSPVADIPQVQNQLMRNFPNPFNPRTNINYSLVEAAEVRIEVYDLKGRRVDTLLHQHQGAGRYSLAYTPDNLASGTYFVLMRAGEFRATQRIMLVK